MQVLFSRNLETSAFWEQVTCPLYKGDAVGLFRDLYEWSVVDVDDIDEEKYALRKKLAEV
jgi:exportin-5